MFYVAHPIRAIETRSLLSLLPPNLRRFTFYVAFPESSIRPFGFALLWPNNEPEISACVRGEFEACLEWERV